MVRVLALADDVDEELYGEKLGQLRPDLLIACGDLPFEYLENLEPPPGAQGCDLVDGRIRDIAGLRVAGLGGAVRETEGPNQYSQSEMRLRALRLGARARMEAALRRRPIDLLVTHVAPSELAEPAADGFEAFRRVVERLRPRILVHGHTAAPPPPDRRLGATLVVAPRPCRLLEL